MGRKNTINVYVTDVEAIPLKDPIQKDHTISLASDFNSLSTSVLNLDNVCYQISADTSDSIGTFYLQGSSDDVDFVDIGIAAIINAADDIAVVWVNQEFCSPFVRLRYDASTPGTGTCSIIFTAKDVGA